MGVGHSVPRDIRAQLCPYGSCPTVCWDTALLPAHRVEDRRVQDQVAQCQQTPQITIITIRIFNKNSMQSSKLCPDLHGVGRPLFSTALLLENKRCKVQWCMKEKQNPAPAATPPPPPADRWQQLSPHTSCSLLPISPFIPQQVINESIGAQQPLSWRSWNGDRDRNRDGDKDGDGMV